jgi:hypothetical protein
MKGYRNYFTTKPLVEDVKDDLLDDAQSYREDAKKHEEAEAWHENEHATAKRSRDSAFGAEENEWPFHHNDLPSVSSDVHRGKSFAGMPKETFGAVRSHMELAHRSHMDAKMVYSDFMRKHHRAEKEKLHKAADDLEKRAGK